MSNITVKYIGKWDSMVCDFNGKRYCFRAKDRIKTIPSEVYDHIKQARDVLSTEIIPHQEAAPVQANTNNAPTEFKSLPLMEFNKLSKEEKAAYKERKAAWLKANPEKGK